MPHKNVSRLWLVFLSATALGVILLLLTLSNSTNSNTGIAVKTARIHQNDDALFLTARINYQLSKEAHSALKNGITLNFTVNLTVVEPRRWLPNKVHLTLPLSYQLKYHTLAKTYQLTDMKQRQHNFSRLEPALHALGVLKDISLHTSSLQNKKNLQGKMKVNLNIEALPLPMRPLAYISPGWHLRSNTYLWPIH